MQTIAVIPAGVEMTEYNASSAVMKLMLALGLRPQLAGESADLAEKKITSPS